jgi:hypothetical protein
MKRLTAALFILAIFFLAVVPRPARGGGCSAYGGYCGHGNCYAYGGYAYNAPYYNGYAYSAYYAPGYCWYAAGYYGGYWYPAGYYLCYSPTYVANYVAPIAPVYATFQPTDTYTTTTIRTAGLSTVQGSQAVQQRSTGVAAAAADPCSSNNALMLQMFREMMADNRQQNQQLMLMMTAMITGQAVPNPPTPPAVKEQGDKSPPTAQERLPAPKPKGSIEDRVNACAGMLAAHCAACHHESRIKANKEPSLVMFRGGKWEAGELLGSTMVALTAEQLDDCVRRCGMTEAKDGVEPMPPLKDRKQYPALTADQLDEFKWFVGWAKNEMQKGKAGKKADAGTSKDGAPTAPPDAGELKK